MARRRAQTERDTGTLRVLVAGTPAVELPASARLRFISADDDWWQSPAERTTSTAADAVIVDDRRGVTETVAAIATLKERGVLAPFLVLTAEANAANRDTSRRAGVPECLVRADLARLPDAVERAVETTRLSGELALLRAKEQRLRALIESIRPASRSSASTAPYRP